MSEVDNIPPRRRRALLISPLDDEGSCVVKDRRRGSYYRLGPQEHYLLRKLNGRNSTRRIRRRFERRFGEPLSKKDFEQFLSMVDRLGFLRPPEKSPRAPTADPLDRTKSPSLPESPLELPPDQQAPPATKPKRRRTTTKNFKIPKPTSQSLLYFRKSLFDPDRLFDRMLPWLGWIWTRTFFVLSVLCITWATALAWANSSQLISQFHRAMRWETRLLIWMTTGVVTLCHEFSHGLTCKRWGGEVHEIGFLMMFFMPCMYCNISDAWLFREKWRRIWVTLSGAYADLLMWSLAVIVWRITYQDSLVKGYLQWVLWGPPRPARRERGKFLLCYGAASWVFTLSLVSLILLGLGRYLEGQLGEIGIAMVAMLAVMVGRRRLGGTTQGEFKKMILKRHKRKAIWLAVIGAVIATMLLVPMHDRAEGTFVVRSLSRAELRAPVAGFLREVYFEEGDQVPKGAVVARLEIPDLASRTRQKDAQINEAKAKLELLLVGTRKEEIAQQRQRVERSETWRDLSATELARTDKAFQQEMVQFDKLLAQYQAEQQFHNERLRRAEILRRKSSISVEEYESRYKDHLVANSRVEQVSADKARRQSIGTLLVALEPADAVRVLVDVANLRGGPDNITAIVARVSSVPADEQADEQAEPPPEPTGSQTATVHPALWGITAVCLLVALALAAMGHYIPALVSVLVGAASAVVGLVRNMTGAAPSDEMKLEAPLGSGPHRACDCVPNAQRVAAVAQLAQQLREATRAEHWTLDWARFDALGEEA
ncbi:MAG: hypothetical protein IIA67_12490, partial [Planctomycetes bacterium]|nr:hypothetical protein [Planctomycetota bacterium]